MWDSNNIAGVRVAVAGFGAEGQSAAEFLIDSGAIVEVFDSKTEDTFPAGPIAQLRAAGVQFHFGAFGPFDDFDAVVRSPGIPPSQPALAAAAAQGIPLTSATQIFFDLCPCPIIGVTGTKGKGTTSSLLHQMLVAGGKDAHLCGNIGAPALDFLSALDNDSIVIYELSSFQLLGLTKSPQVAVVLMITNDHLDFHKTSEDYAAAKANIVRFQKAGDKAIINMDHPLSRNMQALTPADVFKISRKEHVSIGAYVADDTVMLAQHGEARPLIAAAEVPLAGAHNLENMAAAAVVASELGVPDEIIVEAIKVFKALPHRLQFLREVNGVKYYDDSIGTTPESSLAALQSFKEPKVMILGGSSKGADWQEFAAALAADASLRAVIGIGAEWPKIRAALHKEWEPDSPVQIIENLATMADVVRAAAAAAQSGDVVVLSPGCASFDMFRDYQDRGEQFAAAVNTL